MNPLAVHLNHLHPRTSDSCNLWWYHNSEATTQKRDAKFQFKPSSFFWQRNPATPPFTDSTEVPLLTSPSNVTPSMSTGGSADCSANCSGSADSSAAGSAGGSAACVGSSADGSNGSGSQGLPRYRRCRSSFDFTRLLPYCKFFKFSYAFSNLHCWGGHASTCWSQKNMIPCNHHLIFATSEDFQGTELHPCVSRESQLKLPSNRNSKFISRGATHGLVQFSTAS